MDPQLLVPALVVAVLSFLFSSARRQAAQRGDARVVAYPKPWRVLVGLLGLFPVGLLALAVAHPPKPEERVLAAGLVFGFAAVAAALWVEVSRRELHLRADGLEVRWPFGRRALYRWEEVRQARHRPSLTAVELRFADGRTFCVYTYLSGLPELGAALRARAPHALEPAARAALGAF
jgi:hypothetical protein